MNILAINMFKLNILCNHDPKVKSKKAGICDGVPWTAV